jgi:hypothetical protein
MIVFQVIPRPGSTDVAAAATQALSKMSWAVPGSIKYNAMNRELTIEIRATTLSVEVVKQIGEARLALARARVLVGASRFQAARQPIDKK